jgi:probable phosphoglycerate mutase
LKLIIEADGGSRGNPGPAAYGCLVKDAQTNEVLFKEGKTLGITTNNVAEYSGLVAALVAAYELDSKAEIEVRMDSKLVVEQMSGNWKIKHENMKGLVEKARNAFPQEQVKYVWVPREDNLAADTLLNIALDAELNQ